MKFIREIKDEDKTEIELFHIKFPDDKKYSYSIRYNATGKILGIESTNPKIMAYAKKLGLVENDN